MLKLKKIILESKSDLIKTIKEGKFQDKYFDFFRDAKNFYEGNGFKFNDEHTKDYIKAFTDSGITIDAFDDDEYQAYIEAVPSYESDEQFDEIDPGTGEEHYVNIVDNLGPKVTPITSELFGAASDIYQKYDMDADDLGMFGSIYGSSAGPLRPS